MPRVFGDMFKRLRLRRGQSLRRFCMTHGYDPGNISKIERGKLAPPQSVARLVEYGVALGLAEKSQEMQEFIDTGLTCAGQIPPDIMANEYLVARLPVLLRTASGKCTGGRLDELIEMIGKG